MACRIQFPDQGSNPGPPHWGCRILATGSPGKSHLLAFLGVYDIILLLSFHDDFNMYKQHHGVYHVTDVIIFYISIQGREELPSRSDGLRNLRPCFCFLLLVNLWAPVMCQVSCLGLLSALTHLISHNSPLS